MLSIIIKDISIYSNSYRHRWMHFAVLVLLIIVFFIGLTEYYSLGIENLQSDGVNPGNQTFSLLIISMLYITFLVPRYAIEILNIDHPFMNNTNSLNVGNGNFSLLKLSKLTDIEIISGKISAVIIWTLWSIWFLIPIFSLSSYIGGYTIWQLAMCLLTLTINGVLFAIIGLICGLCFPTTSAKGVSYVIILFITLIPLLPFFPFNIEYLDILSSFTGLSSILYAGSSNLWLYNSCLYLILSLLLFPILLLLFKNTNSWN